jgi:hypothetical protein
MLLMQCYLEQSYKNNSGGGGGVSNFLFEVGKRMLRTGLYSQFVRAISPFLFHLILILYNEEANTGGQMVEGRSSPVLSPYSVLHEAS